MELHSITISTTYYYLLPRLLANIMKATRQKFEHYSITMTNFYFTTTNFDYDCH